MANNNKHTGPNVPALRFPEFSGEWIESKLGDIADFSKGAGISKDQRSEKGNPCILYGELYTRYKSEVITNVFSKTALPDSELVKSKSNDIIIPASGETAEDIATARCVPFDNIMLGGDLNIIRLHEQDGKFFSYQLNGVRKYDIATVAQGVSVVHLHAGDLKGITVKYPSHIAEQEKISQILGLIDDRIATQSKIIEEQETLLKSLADRMFSENQYSCGLSELVDIVKGKQVNADTLSEEGDYYVMNGGVAPSGYYSEYNVPAGSISISEGGNSCGYVQFNEKPFWSGGHCYSLRAKSDIVDYKYLYYFLKAKQSDVMELRIGSGLPNIQKKDIEKFTVSFPSMVQQLRYVKVLDAVSDQLDAEKSILVLYHKQKEHLLSEMFI